MSVNDGKSLEPFPSFLFGDKAVGLGVKMGVKFAVGAIKNTHTKPPTAHKKPLFHI
jgi:hypothetical protein